MQVQVDLIPIKRLSRIVCTHTRCLPHRGEAPTTQVLPPPPTTTPLGATGLATTNASRPLTKLCVVNLGGSLSCRRISLLECQHASGHVLFTL
jgi:hypothetical protein